MDSISRVLAEERLSSRFSWESLNRGLAVLDFLLEREEGNGNKILNVEFLKRARGEVTRIVQAGSPLVKASVLVPVGLWGFTEGFSAPDLDIKILGIGNHRFFLFHSALGLVVLRHLYRLWVEKNEHPEKWASRVKRKVAGMLLGTYAAGVGVHLAIDVFQPKAVIFPFFGSLIDGTMVDDNIWLLGNSLWAFHVASDVFAIALADEIGAAKSYVRKHFSVLRGVPLDHLTEAGD